MKLAKMEASLYPDRVNANLHLHSRYSDGTLWPDEIAYRARRLGLEYVALTDHDTLGGTEEFMAAAHSIGLTACVAVEIDCEEDGIGYRSEMLGYFPFSRPRATAQFLEETGRLRSAAMAASIERAREVFQLPVLSFQELDRRKRTGRQVAGGFSFNKVDVFRYLVDAGAVPHDMNYRDFKKAYFDSGLLAGKPTEKPRCIDVIRMIHADGGYAVLPHVGHEFDDSIAEVKSRGGFFDTLVGAFVDMGIDGIEIYYYRNADRDELNLRAADAARRAGLFLTFGSDCHGPGSGKDTIGAFSGPFSGFPGEAGPDGRDSAPRTPELAVKEG